jgi:hypothetical protein
MSGVVSVACPSLLTLITSILPKAGQRRAPSPCFVTIADDVRRLTMPLRRVVSQFELSA